MQDYLHNKGYNEQTAKIRCSSAPWPIGLNEALEASLIRKIPEASSTRSGIVSRSADMLNTWQNFNAV